MPFLDPFLRKFKNKNAVPEILERRFKFSSKMPFLNGILLKPFFHLVKLQGGNW